jgi:glutathione S-transferase
MALHAKKLQYRVEEVTPGIGQFEIFKLSGQKQVPVIVDSNDQVINDSSTICEYLDKKNENNPLFPEDPILFAQCKLIEDWADTTMATTCRKALIKSAIENPQLRTALLPDEIPSSVKSIVDKLPFENLSKISNVVLSSKDNLELQKLLEALSKSLINKKYLVGDSLSIADISIAAQLSLLKFPKSAGPTLSGEGCQEYINNPYLENLFMWRNNLEEYLFSANSQ